MAETAWTRRRPAARVSGAARRRRSTALTCVVLAGLMGIGCSDGGSEASNQADADTTSSSATTTTHPPATDQEAAFPIVEELVYEATDLADELYQDPTAVEDSDDERIARLREVYTDDSPTPDGVIGQLEELNANGQRKRTAASGVFRELVVYQLTAVDDDTIRFRICATEDQETVDGEDNVVDRRAQVSQGTGEARRVDGTWRFYGIHPEDDLTIPFDPGTAQPGFCEQVVDEGGGP
jgi:hypothetical protein